MNAFLSNSKKILAKYINFFVISLPFSFPLIIYEVLFFFIMPYHKGVMIPAFMPSVEGVISEYIIRVLYYIFYVFLLLSIMGYLNKKFEFNIKKRNAIRKISELLLLRCIIDIINFIFIKFTNIIWQSFSNLLLEILFVVIVINFISKEMNIKLPPVKKQFLVFAVFSFVTFTCYGFQDLQYKNFQVKYAPSGSVYQMYISNLNFKMELFQLLFMAVWHLIFVYLLYFTIRYTDLKNYRSKKSKTNQFMKNKKKFVHLLRLDLMLAAMIFVAIFKIVIYPFNSLIAVPGLSSMTSKTQSYVENEYEIVIYRSDRSISSSNNENIPVFRKNFCSVYYDGKKLISFFTDPLDIDTTPKWLLKRYIEIDVDSDLMLNDSYSDQYLIEHYSSDMLLYFDEKTPRAVMLKNIYKEKESEILTATLEKCIKEGYWDYFEYGCEYLIKYDSEFIIPYIIRFSNDEFTENELKQNTHINHQYMLEFANTINEKYNDTISE